MFFMSTTLIENYFINDSLKFYENIKIRTQGQIQRQNFVQC